MKRIVCLLMCLVMIPACALAEKAFPSSVKTGGFQWHIADMIEQYYQWSRGYEQKGKFVLSGSAAGWGADIDILTDSSERIYEVKISALLDSSYQMDTLALMDDVLRSARQTAMLLLIDTDGDADIMDIFEKGKIYKLFDKIEETASLSPYVKRTYKKKYTGKGVKCTEKMELVEGDCLTYEITFTPR